MTTLCASWAAKIGRWLRGLLSSLRELASLGRRLGQAIEYLRNLLNKLHGRRGLPLLREGDGIVRNGKKILMTADNVEAIAAKYGIDINAVRIRIDKVRAGSGPGKELSGTSGSCGGTSGCLRRAGRKRGIEDLAAEPHAALRAPQPRQPPLVERAMTCRRHERGPHRRRSARRGDRRCLPPTPGPCHRHHLPRPAHTGGARVPAEIGDDRTGRSRRTPAAGPARRFSEGACRHDEPALRCAAFAVSG